MAYGKSYFTFEQAMRDLGKSSNALRVSIYRLVKRGDIVSPAKGFYVILPPEYRTLGCLPPEQFIPYLTEYWNSKYYVGLLTAASYQGASHQSPQVFQVITAQEHRPIACGRVKIQFIKNRYLEQTPIIMLPTPAGQFAVSTPEATACDLLKFLKQSGGPNFVITVIDELKYKMSPEKLKVILENQKGISWKQRLGYILEKVDAKNLASVVEKYLSKLPRVEYVLLNPTIKKSGKKKQNKRWKIYENTVLESDL